MTSSAQFQVNRVSPCRPVNCGKWILLSIILLCLQGQLFGQSFTRIVGSPITANNGASRGNSWGDYDNDGDLDFFLADVDTLNRIFRNNGNGTFTRLNEALAGEIANDASQSLGSTWGDYNNDGFLDIFVIARDRGKRLYRNNGNGSFTRITTGPLVSDTTNATACSWADYDNDGFLDIFIANKGQNNQLFRNNGDGTFTAIVNGEIVNDGGSSGGVAWGDYDNDGFVDLYVANDGDGSGENNFFYQNNGDGSFTRLFGISIANDGEDSESAAWADFNNDGFLDLFIANDGPDGNKNNMLYINNNGADFIQVLDGDIVNDAGDSEDCSWGDFNNDGYIDIFIANNVDQDNFLYQNNGDGTFTRIDGINVTSEAGQSEAASWADYDGDGDLDLFVSNDDTEDYLYQNDGDGNNWMSITLQGTISNYSAIGARVRLKATLGSGISEWQLREVTGQSNAKGQSSLDAEFGLSGASQADSLIIDWPSGLQTQLVNLPANQRLTIIENVLSVPPTTPENLQATTLSPFEIRLTWEASNNDPVTYYIYRANSSDGDYNLIDSLSHPLTTYVNINLVPSTTYMYQVSAANDAGESSPSLASQATTDGVPPGPPQGLTANAVSSSQINLNWTPNTDQVDQYYIYRSILPGIGFTLIDSVSHPAAGYNDTGLSILSTYYYYITAVNEWGESLRSSEVSATTIGIRPSAPTNLTAMTISSEAIQLNWSASLNSPQIYYIYRSTVSGTGFTVIDSVNHPMTAYRDTGLLPSTTYYYRVSAANGWGTSGFSGEASATTNGIPPAAPAGLIATTISSERIDLAWSRGSDNTTRYLIYRSATSTINPVLIDSVEHPQTAYQDSLLTSLTTYYYEIRATNQWGTSAASPQDSATTFGVAPTIPGALTVTDVSAARVGLSWQASGNGPLTYRIYRGLSNTGPFARLDSVQHPATTFSDSQVVALESYYYRVSALNSWGESLPSNIDSATVPPAGAPDSPGNLTAIPLSRSSVELNWIASLGNPVEYIIDRSLTTGTGFIAVDTVNHPTTAFTDSGLDSSTTYYYQVRAVNPIGISPPSNEAVVTTPGIPGTITTLTAQVISADSIALDWDPVNGAPAQYIISRSLFPGSDHTAIDSVSGDTTTYIDSGLRPLTDYYYIVQASNESGQSSPSNEVMGTTEGVAPSTPDSLDGLVVSATRIDLSWRSSLMGPEDYLIYRAGNINGNFALIDSVSHPDTVYSDIDLIPESGYSYRISARNQWGESATSAPIMLQTPGVAPEAPANLAAQTISAFQIDLSWDTTQISSDYYRIFRSTTSGVGFNFVDSVAHPQNTFSDSGLTFATTYYYQITAVNQWGESPSSAQDSATTTNIGVPEPPTNLDGLAISTSQIRITWQLSAVGDPLKYRIFRSLTSAGGFVLIDSVDHPTALYNDGGLDSSTTYYYHVRAVNIAGASAASNEFTTTTFGAPTTPLGLSAQPFSAEAIDLRWEISQGLPTRYRIFRSLSPGGAYSVVDSVDHPANSFRDSLLSPLTTYYYRVGALNQWGASSLSNEANATTPGSGTPSAPSGLIAGTVSDSSIILSWNASSGDPHRYRIYRSLVSGSSFALIDSVFHPGTIYLDDQLNASTSYFYVISALNNFGESPFSSESKAATFGPPNAPAALQATAISMSEINLNWGASSGNPQRYRVFRSEQAAGPFTLIDSVNHPITTFGDNNLAVNTSYYYLIYADNEWGTSQASNQASATTFGETVMPPAILSSSISLTPQAPAEGEAVNVQVSVNGTTPTVRLIFGSGSDLAGASEIVLNETAGQFSGQIPAALATEAGIWYRIRAENSADTVYFPSPTGYRDITVGINDFTAIQANGSFPGGIPGAGWNTIALPFSSGQTVSLTSLLGSQQFNENGEPTNWSAFEYSGGGFLPVTTLRSGRGYFLYHLSGDDKHPAVSAGTTNMLTALDNTILTPGWNLIPWPFSFAAEIFIDDAAIIGSIWQQQAGNWQRLTSQNEPQNPIAMARPFSALAIFNKSSGNIALGAVIRVSNEAINSKTLFSKERPSQEKSNQLVWQSNFSVRSSLRTDAHNTIALSDAAADDYDNFDEADPPAPSTDLQLSFYNESDELRRLSSNVKSNQAEGQYWRMLVEASGEGQSLEINWSYTDLPDGWQLAMFDLAERRLIALSGPESLQRYQYRHRGVRRFVVIAGLPDYLADTAADIESQLPARFALSQNYPNPFNPATSVKFSVPSAAKVRLTVYNIIGQKVTVLTDRHYDPGHYTVQWNGTNRDGQPVSSGIYFIRMDALEFTKTVKGILIK